MQTGNTNFIYKNEFDKACFQHDMAYIKSKELTKRIRLDKVLSDKVFKIASDPKCDGYQRGLAAMVYKIFHKKTSDSDVVTSLANKSATKPDCQLANERHEQIIRKFKKQNVYLSLRDIIWGVQLADM